MEGSEEVVMADPPLVIAYPPIKLIIKQEMSNEHQEVNSVEKENWTLPVHYFSLFLKIVVDNSVIEI